jgi:ribosome-associated protein
MRFGRRRGKGEPVVREVPIRDEGIRLGQFLKLADLIDSGADAKPLLADGVVFVNGELETRRGRQLVKGDVVSVGDEAVRVG